MSDLKVINPTLTPTQLVADYETYKRQKISGRSIANANWVTTLAHPCEAYAYWMRTVPADKRIPMKDSLGMVFSEGDDQARAIKRDLLDMGYEVEGAEGQLSWPAYQITGRQDLKIRKGGSRDSSVSAEIKSCAPYTYDSINSVEDLKNHKWTFIQKWYRQVTLYMILKSVEKYWMILKNKSTGQIKVIEFSMGNEEYKEAEGMLKRAIAVNQMLQIGEMPSQAQKISVPDLCSECEMFTVCMPDMEFGVGAQVLADERAAEIEKMLDRRAELQPAGKEYEALDAEVKSTIKEIADKSVGQLVAGNWVITINYQEVKPEKAPRKGFTKQVIKFAKVGV